MHFGKRRPVMLDANLAARLDAIKAAQGIAVAEQVRRAIKLWLDTVEPSALEEPEQSDPDMPAPQAMIGRVRS